MLKPIFENIPAELKARSQWVLWKETPRKDSSGNVKVTKPPYQPNGHPASSTESGTWVSFDMARASADRFDGVGLVLTEVDPYVALDFDHCRCPALDGVDADIAGGLDLVDPVVAGHLKKINSYTEVSPSGKGVRAFVRGTLPVKGKKKGPFEAYRSARYVTVTGHLIDGFPKTIEARQAELDAFCESVFGDEPKIQEAPRTSGSGNGSWRELLARAFNAKNGDDVRRLYAGDVSGYPSQSEAELALCSHLSFWFSGDAAAIDAAMRESGLFRPKWDERHGAKTYGEMTIDKALSGSNEFYQGKNTESEPDVGFSESVSRARAETGPAPINELAFQGLAGEIVRTVEPHTESDPVAILLQSMIVFGNIIGRGPHFCVEADKHYTNENSVIVGETSKGRKGTSDGIVHSLFRFDHSTHLHAWATEKVKSGLSSGEGVTYHVRDATEKDEGVLDKRLFIRETEFGNVLRVLQRQGNTLSPVIRQAWDSGDLAILTKNNPIRATGAHVSISGHITAAELRHYLFEVEIFNGLANRFLWACVKRSKILPEGGRFHTLDVTKLKSKISQAIEFSRRVKEIRRDPEAREIWISVYEELSSGKQGMAGAVLSRAEAHVMRLAVLYALMDTSATVGEEHLMAALAVWEYVEASVRHLFGDRTGDPVADKILLALEDRPEGMTRTEVGTFFDRHVKSERIDDALALLLRSRKITIEKEATGGRPVERIKKA